MPWFEKGGLCAVDTIAPKPTDLLCDAVCESISMASVGGLACGLLRPVRPSARYEKSHQVPGNPEPWSA